MYSLLFRHQQHPGQCHTRPAQPHQHTASPFFRPPTISFALCKTAVKAAEHRPEKDVASFEAAGFDAKQAQAIVLFVRSIESRLAKESSLMILRKDTATLSEEMQKNFGEVKEGFAKLDKI